MEFWQALVIALVPSVAAVITALVAFRDLGLRRRLETSRQFLALFSLAHGRLDSGRRVGIGEQVATIHLIADFAVKEKVVLNAAREGLAHLAEWDASPRVAADLLGAVNEAVPDEQRVAIAQAEAGRQNDAARQVATAARAALKRLS